MDNQYALRDYWDYKTKLMITIWERTVTMFARRLVNSIAICGWCVALTASAQTVEDGAIAPELRADIEHLMQVTQMTDMSRQMGDMMAQVIVQKTGVDTPEAVARCRVIVAEVIRELVADEKLIDEIINIYARHFTEDDVRDMIAFYETPVGKKTIEVMPTLMQEGMQAGQRWAAEMLPGVEERVVARLEVEGIID